MLKKTLTIFFLMSLASTVFGAKELSPLTLAILSNKLAAVQERLSLGDDVGSTDDGFLPVYEAANADSRILKQILDSGANPNTRDPHGRTTLTRAAACRSSMYVDLRKKGGYAGTPPICEESVRLLLQAGADVNMPGEFNRTPLDWAVFWGNYKIAKILLDAGASTESRNFVDQTPLMTALREYATEKDRRRASLRAELPIIELLLRHQADTNVQFDGRFDPSDEARESPYTAGYTPLTLAARHCWVSVAKLLLAAGADAHVTRSEGATASEIAREHGCKALRAVLEGEGSR
jgi:ankyrin repeat protein